MKLFLNVIQKKDELEQKRKKKRNKQQTRVDCEAMKRNNETEHEMN